MLDADIIIVEPNLYDFHSNELYQGKPLMSEHSSSLYRETMIRWNAQISSALKSGKTVICFLTAKEDQFYYTGVRENKGTAGRPRPTNILSSCSNYDFLPKSPKSIAVADGSLIKVTSKNLEMIKEYWDNFSQYSSYRCFFECDQDWDVLLTTKGGEHAVAAKTRMSEGQLIFLPEINWSHLNEVVSETATGSIVENGETATWSDEYLQFTLRLRDAIFALDKGCRPSGEKSAPPEWVQSSEFRLDAEASIEAEMLNLVEQIEALRGKQANLQHNLNQEGSLRDLLFEKGSYLEESVRRALKILGFQVEHFEDADSEFDVIFSSLEGRFVGEVEGKDSRAIDVAKASQLHRNLSEDFARDEVEEMATGVLFGNPFRLTPPAERDGHFTKKVIMFAETVKMILVRTPDLFTAAQHIKNGADSDYGLRCRQAIADAVGGVVTFPVPTNSPETTVGEARINVG